MKKIIYSLVIMIAAGSLFTSCIEQEEPSGIKNLRDAKAQYLASLGQAKVTYANAEKARAEAAAAYDQARAAAKQAEAQATQIQNQLDEIKNKVADAQAQKTIDSLNALKEKFAADAQKATLEAKAALAKAEAEYQNAIDSLAAAAYMIEPGVASVIDTVARAYSQALKMQQAAEIALWKADSTLYRWNQKADENKLGSDTVSIAYYQAKIEKQEENIAEWNALAEKIANFKSTNEWATLLAQYNQEIEAAEADINSIKNEIQAYNVKEFIDGSKAYTKKVDEYLEGAPEKPQRSLSSHKFPGVRVSLDKKVIDLPDYLEDFIQSQDTAVKFSFDKDSCIFKIEGGIQAWHVDQFINGIKTGKKTTEGLKDVIAALEREYVVKESDHSGDAAIQAEIDSLEALDIKAQFDADYDTLKNHLDDWYEKFVKDSTAFFDAADSLAKYINIYQGKLFETPESGKLKKADTTNLIKAINEFGKAEAAYIGAEDSVKFTTGGIYFNPYTEIEALSEISYDYVKMYVDEGGKHNSIYGAKQLDDRQYIGEGGSGSYDAFARILTNIFLGPEGNQTVTDGKQGQGRWSNTEGHYVSPNIQGWLNTKNERGYSFAKAKAASAVISVDDFSAVIFAKENAAALYPEKAAWDTIVARFWGVDINNVDAMRAAYDYDYEWSYDTFAGLVDFKYNGEDLQIKYNRGLAIVLKSLKKDKDADVDGEYKNGNVMNYTKLYPFFLNEYNPVSGYTELAQVFYNAKTIAKRKAQLAGDNLEVLAKLKEFAAAAQDALAAADSLDKVASEANKAKRNAYIAYLNALTGAKVTGVNTTTSVDSAENAVVREIVIEPSSLRDMQIKNIKTDSAAFNLAGLQKEYAEAALPTFVATFNDIAIRKAADNEAIEHAEEFIRPISKLMNSDLKDAELNKAVKIDIDKQIERCNVKIASYKDAIAKLEAGYEPYNVQKAILEGNVADCQAKLEAAKAYVALKKAAFDAIIAQYAK